MYHVVKMQLTLGVKHVQRRAKKTGKIMPNVMQIESPNGTTLMLPSVWFLVNTSKNGQPCRMHVNIVLRVL